MAVDQLWFQNLFERENNERRIAKIIDMSAADATKKGDNYTSEIKRISVNVELGSGERTCVSFITKEVHEEVNDSFLESRFLDNEIAAYSILNCMEELMKARRDTRDTLWCEFKGHVGKTLIFEDLSGEGYACINKAVMANKEESLRVVSELARFHAMGMAVIHRHEPMIERLSQRYMYHEKTRNMFLAAPMRCFRDAVKNNWSETWSDTVDFLDRMVDNVEGMVATMAEISEEFIKVINHGDFWLGNIMFKKDFRGRTLSLKFVDFQLTAVNSFADDLCCFLLWTVQQDLRSPQMTEELLQVYHDHLIGNLEFFQMDASKAPSLEQIKNIMERLAGFSFLLMCSGWPFFDNESDMDLSKKLESTNELYAPRMYDSDKARKILGAELRKLIEKTSEKN